MKKYGYSLELLLAGENLDEELLRNYILENIAGASFLLVGDEDLLKVSIQTDEPWNVLSYLHAFGEIYDVVLENIHRQERGLKG